MVGHVSGRPTIDGHAVNPGGDAISPTDPTGGRDAVVVKIRCSNCNRELPHLLTDFGPRMKKIRCRICHHWTHNINTRPAAFAIMNEHFREGEYERSLGKRSSINLSGDPFESVEVTNLMGLKGQRAALINTE